MNLLPASFRDVPFEVEEVDDELGRHTVVHEIAGGEAYVEDMGERTRRFTIEAHVIGADYQDKLQALEEALLEKGPGKLVHPYRGTLLVALDEGIPVSVLQSTTEGGMARVSISFVEAGSPLAPTIQVDKAASLKASADFALSTIASSPDIDVAGPGFLVETARAILDGPNSLNAALASVNNDIASTFGIIDDFAGAIDDFSSNVNTLLRTPEALALKIQNLVNSLMTAITSAGIELNRGDKLRNDVRIASALGFLNSLTDVGANLDTVDTPTATRQRQSDNQDTLHNLMDVAAIAETVKGMIDVPFDSLDQATDALQAIGDAIDAMQNRDTLDDGPDAAIRAMRAAWYEYLREETIELQALGTYTPPVTFPALCIAWELYGDASRDVEIVDRNQLRNPVFAHGGIELVVSHE